jgi:hypothetical protein
MTENLALKKALACISHPLSIGAVLLLVLNDHLLRHFWPSWWTGKLGDFAWLFFFPFITAAFLAWLLPARFRAHPQWVGGLAFTLVGLILFLAKTLPGFHDHSLSVGKYSRFQSRSLGYSSQSFVFSNPCCLVVEEEPANLS